MVEELLASPEAELPKVVLFADLTTVTAAQFRQLRRRYARDSRVVAWCYRPGLFAEDGADIERELGLVPAPQGMERLGFGDGSLQLNTKTPLFFVDEKPVWAVTLNAGGGKQKMISGSVSGKFEGFAFSALKGSLSLSCGIVKLSASASLSSAQKLTWSLSINVKI